MDLERVGSGRRVSRSRSRGSWGVEDVFSASRRSRRSNLDDDEEALRLAALEKLPTYDRLRTSIIKSFEDNDHNNQGNRVVHKEVDVRKLDINDRQNFIDRLFKVAEEDNEKFLKKFRNRIDK
ncbi:ABC transporter G family member 35 [Vitis vinifera]|uniref:ABC transporter G family member 35 n=1 Tax=Vitis vinifera TaxID=29760 RepID=A0A438CZA9_VITVI|nr:ABC transporter G family member 35 [Vitis vinifera]